MPAIYRSKHSVGPRLHRQMQIRRQFLVFGVGADKPVVHVERVGSHIAQPQHPRNSCRDFEKLCQAHGPRGLVEPVVGIDVLPEQGDFSRPRGGEPLNLRQHLGDRAGDLGTPRVRHDAERAELVAAFLNRDKGSRPACAKDLARRRGQEVELVFRREFGVDDGRVARLGDQLGQAMIILWTDDEVDGGLAAQNFAPLGLGDAAGDDERGVSSSRRSRALQGADLAKLGIDLFRGAFADVAGVEDDEVGVIDICRLGKTFLPRDIGHALRIVDVHLASERLDEHATRV